MDPVENNLDVMDNDDDSLDTSWIQRESQLQNIQTNYAREPMESIQSVFIYINQNNYIEKITREYIPLTINQQNTGSHLTPDMLLKTIQSKKLRTPVSKYKFANMFTHIVDIEPDQIQAFSKTNDSDLANRKFFQEAVVTSLLHIPASIFIFHPNNTLYFFFQEMLVEKHNRTLKSILKPPKIKDHGEPDKVLPHNVTKKVRILDKQDENIAYKKSIQKRGTRRRRM